MFKAYYGVDTRRFRRDVQDQLLRKWKDWDYKDTFVPPSRTFYNEKKVIWDEECKRFIGFSRETHEWVKTLNVFEELGRRKYAIIGE